MGGSGGSIGAPKRKPFFQEALMMAQEMRAATQALKEVQMAKDGDLNWMVMATTEWADEPYTFMLPSCSNGESSLLRTTDGEAPPTYYYCYEDVACIFTYYIFDERNAWITSNNDIYVSIESFLLFLY